jgi:hypothetical protein
MQRECGEGHHLCMEAITTEEVFEAAGDLLTRFGLETPEQRKGKIHFSDRSVPVGSLGSAVEDRQAEE